MKTIVSGTTHNSLIVRWSRVNPVKLRVLAQAGELET